MQLQLQIMILKSPRKTYHQAVLTERHAPENIYQIENADVAAFASAAAAAASAAVNMLSQNALEQPEELYFSRISFFSFLLCFLLSGLVEEEQNSLLVPLIHKGEGKQQHGNSVV